MGLFDFIADVGEKVFTSDDEAAEKIREQLTAGFPGQASNIEVQFDDGAVTLAGDCDCARTRRLLALTAGNIAGVKSVNHDGLRVPAPPAAEPAAGTGGAPAPAPTAASAPQPEAGAPGTEAEAEAEEEGEFYTIASGDSLSAIAKRFYGNASAYPRIFDANREVIKDPDRIYPGQKIFIPKA